MALEFKGINSGGFGGYDLTDQISYNLKWWIDWGLLNNGAFGIFQRGAGGISFYDTTEAELHPVPDERFPEGTIWEGAGREWVWESGVTVPSGEIDPFRVSGVYVDGTFYSQNAVSGGTFGHHVDYQNGRIIFDNPQNPDGTIEAEFTTRSVHVSFADNPEFKEIMLDALEEFEQDLSPSGTPVREHQIWLPAVFIEVGEGRQRGLQLGGGQIKTRFINLHIFADNPNDRNLLKDWLDFQSRASFDMADLNQITWPFDQYGDIVSGITNWPDMATAFPGRKIRIHDATSRNLNSLNSRIFRARVTWEVEIDIGGI
jgi:hypothetical protein